MRTVPLHRSDTVALLAPLVTVARSVTTGRRAPGARVPVLDRPWSGGATSDRVRPVDGARPTGRAA